MFTSRKGLLAIIIVAALTYGIGNGWQLPSLPSIPSLNGGPDISEEAQAHILQGDENGGGHMFGAGKPCKSEFPKDWDESDILSNVRKVAANDNLKWKKQNNGYYVATDKVDGVKIRVVLDKERDDVVTAYPVNTKANSCKAVRKSASSKRIVQEPVETAQTPPAAKSYNFNR